MRNNDESAESRKLSALRRAVSGVEGALEGIVSCIRDHPEEMKLDYIASRLEKLAKELQDSRMENR